MCTLGFGVPFFMIDYFLFKSIWSWCDFPLYAQVYIFLHMSGHMLFHNGYCKPFHRQYDIFCLALVSPQDGTRIWSPFRRLQHTPFDRKPRFPCGILAYFRLEDSNYFSNLIWRVRKLCRPNFGLFWPPSRLVCVVFNGPFITLSLFYFYLCSTSQWDFVTT